MRIQTVTKGTSYKRHRKRASEREESQETEAVGSETQSVRRDEEATRLEKMSTEQPEAPPETHVCPIGKH